MPCLQDDESTTRVSGGCRSDRLETGKAIAEVGRDVDTHPGSLGNWVTILSVLYVASRPGSESSTSLETP